MEMRNGSSIQKTVGRSVARKIPRIFNCQKCQLVHFLNEVDSFGEIEAEEPHRTSCKGVLLPCARGGLSLHLLSVKCTDESCLLFLHSPFEVRCLSVHLVTVVQLMTPKTRER